MNICPFIHNNLATPTTLSEIKRVNDWVVTKKFFGVYAYATQSGISSFELALGRDFWTHTPSKWLFGIDYGRTQPQALRFFCEQENVEVRVFDGSWVVNQQGFIPRRDFHAKMSFLLNPIVDRYGMVVGSGNFSSNGLHRSVEAGATFCVEGGVDYRKNLEENLSLASSLWDNATPAVDILEVYEERWNLSLSGALNNNQSSDGVIHGPEEVFWIEAGYVTKNRGPNRPGNQIDFPRGMGRYFGFNPPEDLPSNSFIGEITFETPFGVPVSNNLRLGNNMMEKISLPIPETHGFDVYDGKVLVFQRSGDRFLMRALEADDFETVFGGRLSEVKVMGSGRRYGHIVRNH